jgi:serine/threonine-protein kinase RsbW
MTDEHLAGIWGDSDELRTVLGDVVELRVRAELDQLFLVRRLTDGLSRRAHLDLTSIIELKVAANEVATSLITRAGPGAWLECCFTIVEGQLTLTLHASARGRGTPDAGTPGWHLLTAITDSITTRVRHLPTNGGWETRIQLTKSSRLRRGL